MSLRTLTLSLLLVVPALAMPDPAPLNADQLEGEVFTGKKGRVYVETAGGDEVDLAGDLAAQLRTAAGMKVVVRGEKKSDCFVVNTIVSPRRMSFVRLGLEASPADQVEVEPRVTLDGVKMIISEGGGTAMLLQRLAERGVKHVRADAWVQFSGNKPRRIRVVSLSAQAKGPTPIAWTTPFPVAEDEATFREVVERQREVKNIVGLTWNDETQRDEASLLRHMPAPRDDWFHMAKVDLDALEFEAAPLGDLSNGGAGNGFTARLNGN